MDPKIFLECLPLLRESKISIDMSGLSSEYASSEVKRTTPIKRSSSLQWLGSPSNLQRLFADHDLRNIHMLWTSFWAEPKKLEQGWGFADLSETYLVVSSSGRIEAYNAHPIRGMSEATDCLAVLANDLESYLEAMLCGAINARLFIPGFPDEDPILFKKTVLVAKQCALIAGGYEYYDFWAGLLGLPNTDTIPES